MGLLKCIATGSIYLLEINLSESHLETSDKSFYSEVKSPGGPQVNVDANGMLLAEDQVQESLQDRNIFMNQNGKCQPGGWHPERFIKCQH